MIINRLGLGSSLLVLLAILLACSPTETDRTDHTVSKPTNDRPPAAGLPANAKNSRAIITRSEGHHPRSAEIDLRNIEPLTLRLATTVERPRSYQLFDSDGILLKDEAVSTAVTLIDCRQMHPGTYLLHVTDEEETTLVTFEILMTDT